MSSALDPSLIKAPRRTCLAEDTLAERLRRRPAKPMGSPRAGSNPTGVVCCVLALWSALVKAPHIIARAFLNSRHLWLVRRVGGGEA